MILDQYREDHRIWELKEEVEQRRTCGEVECYAVETKIYCLIVTTAPAESGCQRRRLRFSFDACDRRTATPTWRLSIVTMSISRSESQYGRRRSNTAQSAFKNTLPPHPPLELGASRVLTAWVHPTGDSSNVMLNHSHLPGVAPGDLLRVTTSQLHDKSGFLFLAFHEDPSMRPQLQVRVICLST